MKIYLKGPFKKNARNLLRDLGYHFYKQDIDTGELVFFRPYKAYPRFHIYLKESNNEITINIHLDQKRPVYKNTPAHQGEYDGEIVESEAERIKKSIYEER